MAPPRKSFSLLDPTSCKAFWHASIELNFSKAASKAGMTQSGVSKHILKLESELQTELFLRRPKQLILTPSGLLLKDYLQSIWAEFESLSNRLLSEQFDLTGQVRYAMPESCLMSPHFSMLLKRRESKFPEINLSVSIAINEVVENLISQDQADFGFMTTPSKKLLNKEFCFENYILVGQKKHSVQTAADLKKLHFIGYPELKTLFEVWSNQILGPSKLTFDDLKIQNTMNDMRGVVTMLLEGPDNHVTLMPEHTVLKELKNNQLHNLNPKGTSASNQIYMVMPGKALPGRVKKIQSEFFEILKDK